MNLSHMFPFILILLFFTPSNASMNPDTIFQLFLQCRNLPSDVVYSSTANTSAYTAILQAYIKNNRFNTSSTPKPAVVITPTAESHVQAAVICAKRIGVQIKIRGAGGGHDLYLSPEKDFVILDMLNFRSIDVDIEHETAVVGAGADLGELYYRVHEKSKVYGFPAMHRKFGANGGQSSGGGNGTMARKYVAVSSGGSYGAMFRKYGEVDYITGVRIVDVNGRILDRNSMGEDLFCAIRGGSGGGFGVILSYTVKLVPVPEVITVARVMKRLTENETELVIKWQTVMTDIDDDLFVRVLLHPVTVNRRRTELSFEVQFFGDSDRLVALMDKECPELGLKKEDCIELSWIQSVLYWANFDINTPPEILLDRHSDNVNVGKRNSDCVQTPITESGVEE